MHPSRSSRFLVAVAAVVCAEAAGGGTGVIDLDVLAIAEAARHGRVVLHHVPLGRDGAVDLDLEPFTVTGPGTRFVLGPDDRPLAFDPGSVTLLRGTVVGEPTSRVFLALSPFGGAGSIQAAAGGRRYEVAAGPRGRLAVFEAAAGGGPAPGVPVCGVEGAHQVKAGAAVLGGADTTRSIKLAIETDYEYFTLFGDAGAAAAYLVQLYGAVSDIYLHDVDARFNLAFVRLWDTPKDLFDDPDPLGPFVDYWNLNMSAVERDVAQFLTGRRDLPYGGVAYLSALCSDFGYSVAGYTLGSFPSVESPSSGHWDLIVTAHALGHNCGTLHTHDYGIDQCNSGTVQRGTIMSYCHTTPGGNANIDLSFHTGTRTPMEAFIGGLACLDHDCNGNAIDDAADIAFGTSADADSNGVPDECQDCNGNGTLDPADIAAGESLDLNGNGTPDECEPDCNGNGVTDDRDILLGNSQDLHGDGVPDECDADCDASATSDYNQIQVAMSLDIDRNAVLDECQDCDGDGTTDAQELGGAHNLWVAGQLNSAVMQMHGASGVLALTSAAGQLASPDDILVRPDGRVLVSSFGNNRVVQYNRDGTFAGIFVAVGAGGLSGPRGMAWRPNGNLLVASVNNNRVLEYDGQTGAFAGEFVPPGAGGLAAPRGLRFGADGNLYVSTDNGRVLRYSSNGSFLGIFVPPGSGGLSGARGLLFKPDGNLLVASFNTNALLEYDGVTGAPLGQWDDGGLDSGIWALQGPWDLELGPDGNVHVTSNSGNAAVHSYDVDTGGFMRSFYVLAAAGPVDFATGLAFIPGDDVDANRNFIPDVCELVPGDIDGDGAVGITDLLLLLAAWGPCPPQCPPSCAADLDGDCVVGIVDLLTLLANWT